MNYEMHVLVPKYQLLKIPGFEIVSKDIVIMYGYQRVVENPEAL